MVRELTVQDRLSKGDELFKAVDGTLMSELSSQGHNGCNSRQKGVELRMLQ